MPRIKLTDEQRRELLEAYQTDEPVASIAGRFGLKVASVATIAQNAGVRRPAGLKPTRTKWSLTAEQEKDLLTAYANDEPVTEIANRLGVPEHVVSTRVRDARVRRPGSNAPR
ncbi:hypothetical protein [Streptosporangium sp. NPDC001681]|uniref:hypothetical protein n=1 Tax=Streptosporangium sp. NPDC001681 TaxID=3154395 RepID=UPI00331A1838